MLSAAFGPQPVTAGMTGEMGAAGASATTVNDRVVYAKVAPSAWPLEKQKASSVAAPAVAEPATTRRPVQAPEEATGSWTDPRRRLPLANVTRATRGPATPAGFGGHGVTEATVM